MKKIILLISFGLLLTGCNIGSEKTKTSQVETKTVKQAEVYDVMILSSNNTDGKLHQKR